MPTTYSSIPTDQDHSDHEEDNDRTPLSPNSQSRRRRSPPSATAVHVDQLFQNWTKTIAKKLKVKKGKRKQVVDVDKNEKVDIMVSVFQVWEGRSSKGKERAVEVLTLDHEPPLTRDAFDGLVLSVATGIDNGIHPRLNSKGSSGSYFARNSAGNTQGIFKPKDEEPYGRLNPKFTKWVHRTFLQSIIPFGRACLIPQLSYLSEAAASLLDRRLEANIVPRTEVVSLSSGAFYYDWIDRERAKGIRGRKLPDKIGSFQVFLKGFQDASLFLRNHPYPGRPLSQTLDTSPRRKKRVDFFAPLYFWCGRAEAVEDDAEEAAEGSNWGWAGEDSGVTYAGAREVLFKWSEGLMASFREELEKLVILDYLMRNTDRGLDNFMLKACSCGESNDEHIHLAAIDNSLSFPHQHPKGWRNYVYGWLYLPVSLIGTPFSQSTRDHYLPLLSSPVWWAETTVELRRLFSIDPDFSESMFLKQIAVCKGQGYNLVQSLENQDEGPLELCRRTRRLVWDEFIEVADDDVTTNLIRATSSPIPPHASTETDPSPPITPPYSPSSTSPRTITMSPTPSVPMSLQRVSSDTTAKSNGRTRRISSVSSVLSGSHLGGEGMNTLTGVVALQQFDRIEAEERDFRRSLGKNRISFEESGVILPDQDEEEEEADEDHDEHGTMGGSRAMEWGVRSESDARHSISYDHRRTPASPSNRDFTSFDIHRSSQAQLSPLRQHLDIDERRSTRARKRSGSLDGVGSGAARAIKYASAGGDESTGDWLRDYERTEESEPRDSEEHDRRRVVVVERMEVIADEPSLISKYCI